MLRGLTSGAVAVIELARADAPSAASPLRKFLRFVNTPSHSNRHGAATREPPPSLSLVRQMVGGQNQEEVVGRPAAEDVFGLLPEEGPDEQFGVVRPDERRAGADA